MDVLLKCWKCDELKPVGDFHKDNSHAGRTRHFTQKRCKSCAAVIDKERRAKRIREDPELAKRLSWEGNLRNKFKMTPDEWNAKNENQNGVCAICGNENTNVRRLALDHDHKCCPGIGSCGKCVRDLLCNTCNTFVGWLEMDLERTKKALDYIGWGD